MTVLPAAVLPVAVLVVAVLAAANLLNNRFATRWYLATSPLAVGLLLVLYAASGAPWTGAGLGAGALRRGAPAALAFAGLVALAYLVLALLPATRPVFLDRRARGAGPGELAYQVLLRIPLGTVLLEEVAFRGVLYGLLLPRGAVVATAVSAVLFGLWHILPSAELTRLNPVAGRAFAGRRALLVAVTVVGMAAAGVVLCEAQRRTGSLLPPVALHWAVNGFAYATAYLVGRGTVSRRLR